MERNNSKISGYLEKKGKRKMIGCYKKYWFVLEGGLLLYYRSKADYETISPCKGSINLGPPCNIKPCPSSTGVFQIQTRMAAVTLRAENREEQNRWMQALMSEINPNKNQQRMSHFRYSMDDLQQAECVETKEQTTHGNCQPSQISKETHIQMSSDSKPPLIEGTQSSIIQRLQKMGAQSCIPQTTIGKLASAQKGNNPQENARERNTKYAELRQNNVGHGNQPADHIYERLAAENIDNNIYCVPDKNILANTTKALTLPNKLRENFAHRMRTSNNNAIRPITFILENDTYSISIQQKSCQENSREGVEPGTNYLIENDQYCNTNTRRDQNENNIDVIDRTADVEYAEPTYDHKEYQRDRTTKETPGIQTVARDQNGNQENKYAEIPDIRHTSDSPEYAEPTCNKRRSKKLRERKSKLKSEEVAGLEVSESKDINFQVENDQYICTNASRDRNENEVEAEENKYAEIPDIPRKMADVPEYAEPICETKKPKKKTRDKKSKEKSGVTKDGSKLDKRPSFLRRVWKRKGKNKTEVAEVERKVDDETYETVPPYVVEKMAPVNDGNAVPVLVELQKLLENKIPMIMRQISNDVGSPTCSSQSETSSDYKTESNIENDLYSYINDLPAPHSPPVPAKPRKTDTPHPQPHYDVPPVELPVKRRTQSNHIPSIDEILQDLDADEERSSGEDGHKVRRLIKRFSDREDDVLDDVVLRGGRSRVCRDEIELDELSRLLEELAKVASAPILKPGVTTSLDMSNLEDMELKKLLPARKRRFSEPDYDIPRPHRSLTILPKTEHPSEAVIGSTRFFGPILKPSGMLLISNSGDLSEDNSILNSMTPDSLEASPLPPLRVDIIPKCEPEVEHIYTSPDYYEFKDSATFNKSRISRICSDILREPSVMVENGIYDEVKCLHKAGRRNGQTKRLEVPRNRDGCESEEFVDSLETCKNEVYTGF